VTGLLILMLEKTRFGAQVRAAVDNQRMARGLGIDVDRAFLLTFALGAGLASIAGSFAAAVVLGISDMAGKYYFPWLGAFLIYLVMVALLMWRPVGLFGKRSPLLPA